MELSRLEKLRLAISLLDGHCKSARETISKQRKRLKAKSEAVCNEARVKIEEAERALANIEPELTTKQLELQFEEASENLRSAYNAFREGQQRALEGGADRAFTDRVATSRFEELESIRATVNLLKKRDAELTDELRQFIQANPRGWMRSDDPLKRYLAWAASMSKLLAFLKDNPRYSVTPDRLIGVIGLVAATPLLKVSFSAFAAQVEAGLLRDTNGDVITIERLYELRTRSVAAASVEIRRRGEEQPIEELLDLIDEQYAEGDGDDISVLTLDTATESILREHDIHRVGQLRRSGDELTNLRGIGEKRAMLIHVALVRRRS